MLLLGTIIGGVAMIAYPSAWCSSQPFRGLIKVEPDSFRTALAEFPRIP